MNCIFASLRLCGKTIINKSHSLRNFYSKTPDKRLVSLITLNHIKLIAFSIFSLFFAFNLFSQNITTYSKISIPNISSTIIQELAKTGIPLEESFYNNNNSLEIVVNNFELAEIQKRNINYTILIQDYGKWLNAKLQQDEREFSKSSLEYIPKGFFYGSFNGYPTLNEFSRMLDTMNILYPNLADQKISIGKTYEGRDLYLVKISNRNRQDTNKKKILYTGLHHAREGASITTVLYYMFYLLENFSKDSLVTYLLNNTEMYFVPLVNPDGYNFNLTNSTSGSLWRKNRHIIGINRSEDSIGIDLNRNYGYKWGYDNIGSSPNVKAEVYRGSAPFSELETQAIRTLCLQNKFITAINFHTFGNYIVYPWGYTSTETPDYLYYRQYGSEMAKFDHYTVGTADQTVNYNTNGDSDDWMYGEQREKNKILAMTIETGNSGDNFWAPITRIVPIAQENLWPNLFIAKIAGAFIDTIIVQADTSSILKDTVSIKFQFRNIGLQDAKNIKIKISSKDSLLSSDTVQINYPSLISLKYSDPQIIQLIWNKNAPDKYPADYTIELTYNGIPYSKKFTIIRNKKPSALAFRSGFSPEYPLLYQNHPNPFNPSTMINYQLPKRSFVSLKIYDLLGKEVTTLVSANQSAGAHNIIWNATGVPSGIYYYRLSVDSFIDTKKLILLK
jgi:hypothetical protein